MKPTNKPITVLHVGFGKAASTALQRWFAKHPNITLINQKELYGSASSPHETDAYVMSDEHFGLGLDFDKTTGQLSGTVESDEKREKVATTLKQVFPSAAILIVTRSPYGFLNSFYAQYVRKGGTLAAEEFFTTYKDTLVNLLDIDRLVSVYASHFGEDNVIVLPYELLRDDPDRFIAQMLLELGIRPHKHPIQKLNKAPPSSELHVYVTINRITGAVVSYLPAKWRVGVIKWKNRTIIGSRFTSLLSQFASLFPENAFEIDDAYLSPFSSGLQTLRRRELYEPFLDEYFPQATPPHRGS